MAFGRMGARGGFGSLGLLGGATRYPMPSWQAAKAAVLAGTRNAKILCLGDSTTVGQWALSAADANAGDCPYSYPMVLAGLNGLLANASGQTYGGNNGVTPTPTASYDARFTNDGTWTNNTPALGGGWLTSSTLGGTLIWAPATTALFQADAFDTIEIWYPRGGGLGSFTVDVGGAVLSTINQLNGSSVIGHSTISCPLGTHPINIKVASGAAFIGQIAVYNSVVKKILVIEAGWSGKKAADLAQATPGYGPLAGFAAQAPDLTILCCTINDWVAATSTSSYTTNMQTLITTGKASGDVLLMSGAPSDPSQASIAQQQAYIDICASLARQNGVNFINLTQRWGSYAQANANGYMQNLLHPKAAGYADIAAIVNGYL